MRLVDQGVLSNQKVQLGKCGRWKDPVSLGRWTKSTVLDWLVTRDLPQVLARGLPLSVKTGRKISQIDPPNKIKNYRLFQLHLRDDKSHSLLCHLSICSIQCTPVGRELRGVWMSGGGDTWNSLPYLTFLLLPPPIQENNYFCWFPLPNLTSSCVEPSTETSTRQEQPTLN